MKNLFFILLIAFFASSLAVSAQNSSKLSYNEDGSVTLTEELKTKLKAKGISEENYLKQMAVNKQNQQPVQQQNIQIQTKQTQAKAKFKTMKKSQLNGKTLERKAILENQKEDLKAKALQMNLDFAKKGLRYHTQVKTIGGKQYIQIIESPKQIGMAPPKSNQ